MTKYSADVYELIRRFQDFAGAHKLFTPGMHIVLGLSGGVDSTVLFWLLKHFCTKFEISFSALHFNHKLRGRDADADEFFVRKLCAEHNVHLTVKAADVMTFASEHKAGVEEAARFLRHQALENERLCYENAVKRPCKIALAHHADDIAETLMLNIARGSGISGLAAMMPQGERIIRPLAFLRRSEIKAFAKAQNLAYREDRSNAELCYKRNLIRHQVLPYLNQALQVDFPSRLLQLQKSAGEMQEFLQFAAHDLLRSADKVVKDTCLCVSADGGKKSRFLDIKTLVQAPDIVVKAVLADFYRAYLYELLPNDLDRTRFMMNTYQLNKILELLKEKTTRRREVFLPYGVRAIMQEGIFFLQK